LTPEQSQKVRAVFESKRAQFKEIQESSQKEIEKILTPDQLPAFKKMQAEWQARREKWSGRKESRD
jgi:Spy/CpxP family protein refolding chaperone